MLSSHHGFHIYIYLFLNITCRLNMLQLGSE